MSSHCRSRRCGSGPSAAVPVPASRWRSSTAEWTPTIREWEASPVESPRAGRHGRTGSSRRGAPRRPGRPRHGLRRNHPVARSGRRDLQRPRAGCQSQGSWRLVARRCRVERPARHARRQPVAVEQGRGDVRPIARGGRPGLLLRHPLVCAANNLPGPTYPSQYASVISVAARAGAESSRWPTTVTHRWSSEPAASTSTSPGRARVDRATGNSFAAPHVTAMVALMRRQPPRLTPLQVKAVLHAASDNSVPGSGRGGTNIAVVSASGQTDSG